MMGTEGEPAVADVARAAGIPYALSTMGTTTIEAMASAAPGGRHWFQLYLWRDRSVAKDLVARAEAAGYGHADADRGHPGPAGTAAATCTTACPCPRR